MQFDIRELADKAGLKVYDTALPYHWYDDVHKLTGFWPQEYGFVWCYDTATTWGEAYPLTDAAKILLAFYNKTHKMVWTYGEDNVLALIASV